MCVCMSASYSLSDLGCFFFSLGGLANFFLSVSVPFLYISLSSCVYSIDYACISKQRELGSPVGIREARDEPTMPALSTNQHHQLTFLFVRLKVILCLNLFLKRHSETRQRHEFKVQYVRIPISRNNT